MRDIYNARLKKNITAHLLNEHTIDAIVESGCFLTRIDLREEIAAGSWDEDKERDYQVASSWHSWQRCHGVALAKTFKKSFGRERESRTMDGPEEREREKGRATERVRGSSTGYERF